MEKQQLTKQLAADLKQQGYRAFIAKGAPQQESDGYYQTLIASRQEPHNEETAEATWQTSVDDEKLFDANVKYWVETE